jgi:hypothetical protein
MESSQKSNKTPYYACFAPQIAGFVPARVIAVSHRLRRSAG